MKKPLENCNTVTSVTNSFFLKKVTKTFENRNGNVVSLHCVRDLARLGSMQGEQFFEARRISVRFATTKLRDTPPANVSSCPLPPLTSHN